MVIKELSKNFRSYGVIYQQVRRTGDICMYSLRYCEGGAVIGYDVVQVQSSTGEELNRRLSARSGAKIENYEPGTIYERYPASSQWGSRGWSFDSLQAATEKYGELVRAERQKTVEMVSGGIEHERCFKIGV